MYGYDEASRGLLSASTMKESVATDAPELLFGSPNDEILSVLDSSDGVETSVMLTLTNPVYIINLTLSTFLAEAVTVSMFDGQQEEVFTSTVSLMIY